MSFTATSNGDGKSARLPARSLSECMGPREASGGEDIPLAGAERDFVTLGVGARPTLVEPG